MIRVSISFLAETPDACIDLKTTERVYESKEFDACSFDITAAFFYSRAR